MPTLTLADLTTAADKKFLPVTMEVPTADGDGVETLTFVHIMRRPRAERKAYGKTLDFEARLTGLSEADELGDMDSISVLTDAIKDSFRVVAETPHDFERLSEVLVDANGEDQPDKWQELFAVYNSEVASGEASPSQKS